MGPEGQLAYEKPCPLMFEDRVGACSKDSELALGIDSAYEAVLESFEELCVSSQGVNSGSVTGEAFLVGAGMFLGVLFFCCIGLVYVFLCGGRIRPKGDSGGETTDEEA